MTFQWTRTRTAAAVAIAGLVLFVWSGHLASDNRYADQLMVLHGLHTPDEVFRFLLQHKQKPPIGSCVTSGQSFRQLIDRPDNLLFCDEGAVVMAVFAHRMALQARIVDLVSRSDGLSHHSVVQVGRDDQWTTYDFTHGRQGMAPEQAVDDPVTPRYRPYPQWMHRLMLANAWLRVAGQASVKLVRPAHPHACPS